jgi:hypothetical protein
MSDAGELVVPGSGGATAMADISGMADPALVDM